MLLLLTVVVVPAAVLGHGGMVWPPIWQDGRGVRPELLNNSNIGSEPPARDPVSGRDITQLKVWLTDQAYVGGHGPAARGTGEFTNPDCEGDNGWENKVSNSKSVMEI